MTSMKNIYGIILMAVALIAGLASCDVKEPLAGEPELHDKVSPVSTDAVAGELLVRFDEGVSEILDAAGLITKSGEAPARRSGILTVDEILDLVDGYQIERVFPVDVRSEEKARKEGLHLWYVVRFSEEHPVEKVAADLSRLGEVSRVEYNRTLKRASDAKAVPVPSQVLSRAAGNIAGHNDPLLKYQWHLVNNGADQELPVTKPADVQATFLKGADVGMREVWENNDMKGHPSIIVAVLDEGVCFTQPDLQASMWVNEGEIWKSHEDNDGNGYAGDVHGYNFVSKHGVISTDSRYDTGHGTHVAGILAGDGRMSKGILAGIAPKSQIVAVKILDREGNGNVSHMQEGIQWVLQNKDKYQNQNTLPR